MDHFIKKGFVGYHRAIRTPSKEVCGLQIDVEPITVNSSVHHLIGLRLVLISPFAAKSEEFKERGSLPSDYPVIYEEHAKIFGHRFTEFIMATDIFAAVDENKTFDQPGWGSQGVPFLLVAKNPQDFPFLIEAAMHALLLLPTGNLISRGLAPIINEYLKNNTGRQPVTQMLTW